MISTNYKKRSGVEEIINYVVTKRNICIRKNEDIEKKNINNWALHEMKYTTEMFKKWLRVG